MIKKYLQKWLGITALENDFKQQIKKLELENERLKIDLKDFEGDLNTIRSTLFNTIKVVVDVNNGKNKYERSWAMVCIKNENENCTVHFYDLGQRGVAIGVRQFLDQFKGADRCMDTPHGIVRMSDSFFNKAGW